MKSIRHLKIKLHALIFILLFINGPKSFSQYSQCEAPMCGISSGTVGVFYDPAGGEELRKTAKDVATLLGKATNTVIPYCEMSDLTHTGIILDIGTPSTPMTKNSSCDVFGVSQTRVIFTAPIVQGLKYGVYQYLEELGFRFYLPEMSTPQSFLPSGYDCFLWTNIPSNYYSPFQLLLGINKRYSVLSKYHAYFGGTFLAHKEYMPNDLLALNEWLQWKDRNSFKSDVQDCTQQVGREFGPINLNSGAPCYVAKHMDWSAVPPTLNPGTGFDAKPDINSSNALDFYSNICINAYGKDLSDGSVHLDDPYFYQSLSIETGDPAGWGNYSPSPCQAFNWPPNNDPYPSPADQNFIMANHVANSVFSNPVTQNKLKAVQVYAYQEHSDLPSYGINIDDRIDVIMCSDLYNNLFTSTDNALRLHWKDRIGASKLGEYPYYNTYSSSAGLPFYWEKRSTFDKAKWHINNGGAGLFFETHYSKFSPGFILQMANRQLKDGSNADLSYDEFFDQMFGSSSSIIKDLFDFMGKDFADVSATPNSPKELVEKRYLMYQSYKFLKEAYQNTQDQKIKWRISELKAYFHFVRLMLDYLEVSSMYVPGQYTPTCPNSTIVADKFDKLAGYLYSILPYKLVNSTGIISSFRQNLLNKCGSFTNNYIVNDFWNLDNGTNVINNVNTAYPPITYDQMNSDFDNDMVLLENEFTYLKMEFSDASPSHIYSRLTPRSHIPKVQIKCTGISQGAAFQIYASGPGIISLINYNVCGVSSTINTMPQQHYALVVLDNVDKNYSEELKIYPTCTVNPDELFLKLPEAGVYTLSFFTTIHGVAISDITIKTYGNLFYQTVPQAKHRLVHGGNNIDFDYNYFYVPLGMKKVYMFNLEGPNALPSNPPKFISPGGCEIKPVYMASENYNVAYFNIPSGQDDNFWQIQPGGGGSGSHYFSFLNISNKFLYLNADYNLNPNPWIPPPSISSNGPLICEGETLKLYATSSTPGVTYTWTGPNFISNLQNPIINPVSTANAGLYTCMVSLSPCASNEAIPIQITVDICPECIVDIIVNTPVNTPVTHHASNSVTGSSSVTISDGEVIFKAGNYVLLEPGFETFISSNGIFIAEIEECAGRIQKSVTSSKVVSTAKITDDAKVYPNPFTNNINYSLLLTESDKKIEVELINNGGQLVYKYSRATLPNEYINSKIDGGNIPPGIYYMTLRTSRKIWRFKVVKL